MKLTKRLTIVCLAIALVLSVALLLQPVTSAQASTTVGGIEFTKELSASSFVGFYCNISEAGNYYLADDLDLSTLSKNPTIEAKKVNIDLNGHALNLGQHTFFVSAGAELNIYDSNPNGTSHVFYSDAEHPNYYISSEGLTNPTTTVVKGGVIYSQGSGSSNPTFEIYGNYAEYNGTPMVVLNGGTLINPNGYTVELELKDSKFIMNGGAIRGSSRVTYPNPNYGDRQLFEMNGGVISDCHSPDYLISNDMTCEVKLLGGEITNNTLTSSSSALGIVYFTSYRNVTIGDCRIADNTIIMGTDNENYHVTAVCWDEGSGTDGTFALKGKPYIADNVVIRPSGSEAPANIYICDAYKKNRTIDTSELAYNATVCISNISSSNPPKASNPITFTCANTSNLIGAIVSDNPTYGLKLGTNNEVMLCVASEAQAPFGVELAGTFSGDEIALLTESNMETYEERRVTAGANELALDSLSMNLTDANVEFNAYFLVTLNPGINALVLNLDYETDIFELATDDTGAYKLSATSLLGGVDGECTVTGTETDAEGIKLEFDALNNDSSLSTSSSSYLVCATFTLKSGLTQSEVEGKHEITFDDDSYAAYVSGESATGTTLTNVCKVTTTPAVVYIRKTASISIDETKVTYDASAKNFAWAPSGTVGTDFVGRYECAGATEETMELIASTYSTSLHSDTWYSYADSTYTKITADEGNIINAGTYYVKLSADQNKEYMAVEEDYYPVVISQRNLEITAQADPESKQYTGSAITWDISEFSALSDDRLPADSTLELYTITEVLANSYTDVGEYAAEVYFTISDTSGNYAFIGIDYLGEDLVEYETFVNATIKISKAPNNWVTGHIPADVTRYYDATAFEPDYQAEFGTPVILYSTDNDVFTELTEDCILNAGTYYIKASVPADENGNYDGVDEKAITYVINKVTLGSDFALDYSVDGEVSWAEITTDSEGNDLPYDCVVSYYVNEELMSTTFALSTSGSYTLYATPTDTTNYVGSSIDLKTVYTIEFAEGSHERVEEYALTYEFIKGARMPYDDYKNQYRFEDQKVTEPTDPSLSKGYTFEYWENSASEYDFATAVKSNLTLTAIWELKSVTVVWSNAEGNALTITEEIPEGTTVDEEGTITQTYYFGDTVAYPGNTPTKDADAKSYTFSKWQDSTSLEDLDVTTFVIDDVEFGYTFVAIYDETLNEFYVTFIVYNEFGAVVDSYTTVEKLRVGTQLSGYASEFGEYAWYKLLYWYESKDSENKVFSSKVLILPEPTDEQKDDPDFVKEVYGYYKFDIGTGDVSGDGIINAPSDITTYRQWIVGGYTMTVVSNGNEWNTVCDSSTKANIYSSETKYFLLRTADVNKDSNQDVRDVTTIRMAIVGGYGYYINMGDNVSGEEIDTVQKMAMVASPSALNAMLASSASGAQLSDNITIDEDVEIESEKSLVLNEKTLKVDTLNVGSSTTAGDVTIEDGTLDADIVVADNSKLTLKNVVIPEGKTITLGSGSDTVISGSDTVINAAIETSENEHDVDVTISGGTFKEEVELHAGCEYVISGGTFEKGLICTNGNLTITGGTFGEIADGVAIIVNCVEGKANVATYSISEEVRSAIAQAGLTIVDPATISSAADLIAKLSEGGYLALSTDIDLAGAQARFAKDVFINLNGHAINNGELGVVGKSSDIHFTIVNGTVNSGEVTNAQFALTLTCDAVTAVVKNVHAVGFYGGLVTNGKKSGVSITAEGSQFEGTSTTDSTAVYLPANGDCSFTDCEFTGATAVGVKSGNNNFVDCKFVVIGEHVAPVKSTSGINSCGVGVAVQPTNGYTLPVHVRLEDCEFSGCDAQYEIEYVNFSSVETSTVVVVEDGVETPITAIEPNA